MNNNINTMNNNNNDNNNNNTMNNSSRDSSSSIPIAEAVLSTPAQKHQPGSLSALYKLGARNLRQHHGVPSMTALKLEKTVALLGLAPCRIVVQGLAPRRLLKGGKGGSSPLASAGEISREGKENLREAETDALVDDNIINHNNSSAEDQEGEEEEAVGPEEGILFSDDSSSIHAGGNIDYSGDDPEGLDSEGFKADGNGNGIKTRRPIHAALIAGGINLRPRETRPLLRALGVSPHRLVKLGLVTREAVRALPGRGGGGPGQHVRAGGPRKAGVGGPRGPPLAHGCGPSSGCGLSRPMHVPPRGHLHGAGHHTKHIGEESGEEEGLSTPLGPHGGPEHRGPRHRGERLQGPPHGPGHHSMPIAEHGRGPPGCGKHGPGHGRGPPGGGEHRNGHRQPPHGHEHGHGGGEGGGRMHAGGPRGPGQHGLRRHGEGKGDNRSRGRPQGPPHGPPHGPFQEGVSGAPPGVMAHRHHGSPSRGGRGMKQRGGRQGGRTGSGGGRGGGGGRKLCWRAHLPHFDKGRQQPQLEAY